MKNIRLTLVTLAFSFFLIRLASAGTVQIPEDSPAISVRIPDSWKPEGTDKGIACESPDQVATIFLEVTSRKGSDALISENVKWLTHDQGVDIDQATEREKNFEDAGIVWRSISWTGNSKEWGPAIVGFMFTEAGNGKVLTVTYWITEKDKEKQAQTLNTIFESVKRVGR
jgi:hypothetical protein